MTRVGAFLSHALRSYGPYYLKQKKLYSGSGVDADFEPTSQCKELMEFGVVQLEALPMDLVDRLISADDLDARGKLLRRDSNVVDGLSERMIISLNDEELQRYLGQQVFPHIRGYMGREYVLRGNPRVAYNVPTSKLPADHFHLDFGLHQLTLQVLLTDLDTSSTHMEYIERSNRSSWFSPRSTLFPTGNPNQFKSSKPRRRLVGKAGSAFLFDAGNGYHRACVKNAASSYRKVLSINFTANTHLDLPSDIYEDYAKFSLFETSQSGFYSPFRQAE